MQQVLPRETPLYPHKFEETCVECPLDPCKVYFYVSFPDSRQVYLSKNKYEKICTYYFKFRDNTRSQTRELTIKEDKLAKPWKKTEAVTITIMKK